MLIIRGNTFYMLSPDVPMNAEAQEQAMDDIDAEVAVNMLKEELAIK